MKINRPFLRQLAGWSVLVVVPLALFALPIIRGQVLLPTDILPLIDDVWAGKVVANNPLLSDVLLQFYPWQSFAATTIANGHIPLWNPFMLAGAPFLANDQSAVFEPLRFLALVARFPVEQSFLFLAIGRLLLFGFFTAWWLRGRGFQQRIAVSAAGLAILSAPVMAWLSYPLFATFLWLPLILLGLDRLAGGQRRGWYITAGAVAAQWCSGNLQISLFLALLSIGYVFFIIRPQRKHLGRMAFAALIGTCLAAIQILPTAAFIRQSPVYDAGRGGYGETNAWQAITTGAWRGWDSWTDVRQAFERLLPIVSPFVHGNPASGTYRFPGKDVYANMNELAGSVGAVGLLLAVIGLITNWRDRLVRFSAVTATFLVAVIAHAPIFELFNYLPLIQQTQTDRLRFFVAWCLVILAAFGLRALVERRVTWRRFLLIAGSEAAILAIVGWRLGVGSDWKTEGVLFALSAVLLAAVRLARAPDVLRSALLLVAVTLGPLVLWSSYNTAVDVSTTRTESSVLSILQERITPQDRFVSFDVGTGRTPLEPNTGTLYSLRDVRGYDVVRLRRYDALVTNVLTQRGSHIKGASQPSEILNALAVRFGLVAQRDVPELDATLRSQGWVQIAEDERVRLYENPRANKRAMFVTRVINVGSSDESLAAVTASSFSAAVPVIETTQRLSPTTTDVVTTVAIQESPNALTLQLEAPVDGYVIVADAIADGWTAKIDNQPGTIFVANHALRGLAVPAGQHTITMVYRPTAFLVGSWITLVAATGVAGTSFFIFRRRKR